MEKIISRKVAAATSDLLNCKNVIWNGGEKTIETTGTPLANQPSPYIKSVYEEEKIGAVKKFSVKSFYNDTDIFFYMEWDSAAPQQKIGDINVFPDGAALLFPFKETEKTQINEMGSKDYPTNAWFWRPDFDDKPKNQISHGLSTSTYTEKSSIRSHSRWESGKWKVVMGRPLKASRQGEETVDLYPGRKIGIGYSIWEGRNGERGGVKAFSREWMELVIEA